MGCRLLVGGVCMQEKCPSIMPKTYIKKYIKKKGGGGGGAVGQEKRRKNKQVYLPSVHPSVYDTQYVCLWGGKKKEKKKERQRSALPSNYIYVMYACMRARKSAFNHPMLGRSAFGKISKPHPFAPSERLIHSTKRTVGILSDFRNQGAFSLLRVAGLEILDAAVCVLDISAGASSWTFCFLGTLAHQYSPSAAATLKMIKAHKMPKLRYRFEYDELTWLR